MAKKKKKNCQKGYSCGMTCISVLKACLKEFPDGVAVNLQNRSVERSYPVDIKKPKAVSAPAPVAPPAPAPAPAPVPTPAPKSKTEPKKFDDIKEKSRLSLESNFLKFYTKSDELADNTRVIQLEAKSKLSDREAYELKTRKALLARRKALVKKGVKTTKVGPPWMPKGKEATKEFNEMMKSDEFNIDLPAPPKAKKTSWTDEEIKQLNYGSTDVKDRQSRVYEQQGFNAKPTLVDNIEDIRFNDNIFKDPKGRPMMMFRGVKDAVAHEDLMNGDKHWVGNGIYGNGTYFAVGNSRSQKEPVFETFMYGGKIVAAGLHKDSNVWQGNTKEFKKFTQQLEKKYSALGKFPDVGELMALEGYDAYLAGSSDGKSVDYYVVLNRGALVVTQGYVPRNYS